MTYEIEQAGDAVSTGDGLVDQLMDVAARKPLSHPLAFSMTEMNFELAPPPHLVDIYQSAYEGLHPDIYPNAFQNQAKIMPRDHGKSEAGAHVIPSWFVIQNPNRRVLIMMESEGQAIGKLAECSETIKRVGPKYGIEITRDSATELTLKREQTHAEPTIRAAGFETSITGGHYDLIVFDDLITDDSVHTEARRDKTWEKFQERLNLKSGNDTVFLVLGTRKHPDDLYQKLLDSGGWKVTVEQAIKDWSIVENGEYDVVCEVSEGQFERFDADEYPRDANITRVIPHRDAQVLWPERYSLEDLIMNYLSGSLEDDDAEEQGLEGSRVWIRENQNIADALMGEILSEEMLTFVDGLPEGKSVAQMPCYASLDPANEADAEKAAKNDTDYFAWSVAYYDTSRATFYIDDVRRKRGVTMKEACSWVHQQMQRYPTNNIWVESNQAQTFLAQQLRDEGLFVHEVDNVRDKEARIKTMSARFESGKAVIIGNKMAPHWDSFIREWVQFPSGDHDDRLDAVQLVLSARNQEDEESKKTARRPFV